MAGNQKRNRNSDGKPSHSPKGDNLMYFLNRPTFVQQIWLVIIINERRKTHSLSLLVVKIDRYSLINFWAASVILKTLIFWLRIAPNLTLTAAQRHQKCGWTILWPTRSSETILYFGRQTARFNYWSTKPALIQQNGGIECLNWWCVSA